MLKPWRNVAFCKQKPFQINIWVWNLITKKINHIQDWLRKRFEGVYINTLTTNVSHTETGFYMRETLVVKGLKEYTSEVPSFETEMRESFS